MMNSNPSPTLQSNASILKQKASRHSILGVIIAIVAILIATILSGFFSLGEVSLKAFVHAQQTNIVLWFLDAMPFVFALWGQFVSSILSLEAGAMVFDQTHELRQQSETLEKKAAHDATHDSLTGLPNRTLFLDRLQQATIMSKRDEAILGVLLLDMDRFKEVNDTLGHYYGDRLLKQLAIRLSNVIRESDTIARIGGDEFGFVLPQLQHEEDVENIVKKIQKSLTEPFMLNNLALEVQVSIGATLYPEHGTDADTLIQRADVAMYVAKQRKLGFAIYSAKFDEHSPQRLTLMGELRRAIQNNELLIHYQPKILSATGEINAVEALVRWKHPTHGMMPPDEFIPLAERTGLIDDLTIWVLKRSLAECSFWHNEGFKLKLAINVSVLSLLNPEFPGHLLGLLRSHDFPAESLIMEITETSIMMDPQRSMEILQHVHDQGVNISIDDFGTGYSSLSYLKKLPVSELKIDKSFVTDMLSNDSDSAIVNATIQLAHNLGLKVVAEGVESKAISDELHKMGCDLQQGFFISRPQPPEALLSWASQQVV